MKIQHQMLWDATKVVHGDFIEIKLILEKSRGNTNISIWSQRYVN